MLWFDLVSHTDNLIKIISTLSRKEKNDPQIKNILLCKKILLLLPSSVDALGVVDEAETLPPVIVAATRLSMICTERHHRVQYKLE